MFDRAVVVLLLAQDDTQLNMCLEIAWLCRDALTQGLSQSVEIGGVSRRLGRASGNVNIEAADAVVKPGDEPRFE